MINSQPPTPNVQLKSICRDSGGLGIGNWDLEVDAAFIDLLDHIGPTMAEDTITPQLDLC
jgi:hypothetical protein